MHFKNVAITKIKLFRKLIILKIILNFAIMVYLIFLLHGKIIYCDNISTKICSALMYK